jgi:hypothetical protein
LWFCRAVALAAMSFAPRGFCESCRSERHPPHGRTPFGPTNLVAARPRCDKASEARRTRRSSCWLRLRSAFSSPICATALDTHSAFSSSRVGATRGRDIVSSPDFPLDMFNKNGIQAMPVLWRSDRGYHACPDFPRSHARPVSRSARSCAEEILCAV